MCCSAQNVETRILDLKQQLMNQAFKLMQDPRVGKALQNPRVMQGLMGAVQLSSKVQQNLDSSMKRVVQSLNLATSEEVDQLRQTIARLENQIDDQQHRS